MTGERELIAKRRAGVSIGAVWILDADDHFSRTASRDWHLERNVSDQRWHAHIRIDGADIPEALDLRFVVGLTCHIVGERGAARFHRIFDAVKAAGAAVIVGVIDNQVRHERATEEQPIHG